MLIEEEIKVTQFKNVFIKAVINLMYTANWLNLVDSKRLKPFGISPEQYNVLRILRGQYPNPSSIQLVTERMLNPSSNASRIVEKLRLKNLAERKVCPSDRRAVEVLITAQGLDLLDKIGNNEEGFLESHIKIDEQEAIILSSLLDKMRG